MKPFLQSDTLALVAATGFAGVLLLTASRTLANAQRGSRSEERPKRKPKAKQLGAIKKVLRAAAFLHAPLTAVTAVYSLVAAKPEFLSRVPALFASYGSGLQAVLPLHAKNLQEAFQLGTYYEAAFGARLQLAPQGSQLHDILRNVSLLAGRPDVTVQQLLDLPDEILRQDDSKSAASRVLSLFSVVNLVWVAAILGMTLTAPPTVVYLTKPIHRKLLALWSGAVKIAHKLRFVAMDAAYAFSFFIVIESARYTSDAYSLTGTMVALTGLCSFALSWIYNTYLFADGSGEHFELWFALTTGLLAATSWALAALHQSTFLGYLAVGALLRFFYGIGLRSVYFGTDYDRSADSILAGCMLLGLGNALCRALSINSHWVSPVQPAVALLSSTVYLWILLLGALRWSSYRFGFASRETAVYCANIAALYALGEVLAMPNMTLVAETYGGLFAFLAFLLALPRGGALIFSVFFGSGALYFLSLYVSRHPQYLAGLLGF